MKDIIDESTKSSNKQLTIEHSSQFTNLCFQSFIALMDFCHSIKCWVVGKQTSIQEASHWSKIGWGSTTGTGSSPYELFWCEMRKASFYLQGSPEQIICLSLNPIRPHQLTSCQRFTTNMHLAIYSQPFICPCPNQSPVCSSV